MNQTERIYKISTMIRQRGLVSFAELQTALEVSRATLNRDLTHLRDRLHSPIIFDRDAGGYRLEGNPGAAKGQYELPGLWFSASEIHALLTMQHLLANLEPGGLLGPHVQPIMVRLNGLIGSTDDPADEIRKRVLIIGVGKRAMKLAHFEKIGSALLQRRRLHLSYDARSTGETSEREVSPQRLVHYRENWYLDAWCHLRNELRTFSVDTIQRCEILDKPAREVSRGSVDTILGPGYGIFVGKTKHLRWASLHFTPARAKWVASEAWHPKQKGITNADGSYTLEIPYTDDRELLMDILKYGADCEVIAPESLRLRVTEEVTALAKKIGVMR